MGYKCQVKSKWLPGALTSWRRPAQYQQLHKTVCQIFLSVCSVISGGQLKRTGTTDEPAPTEV
jgi:hypothetical protein